MSTRADVLAFVPTGKGNEFLSCDGFALSFRPSSAGPALGIREFAADDGRDETALIVEGDYYILNGDFRSEYLSRAPQGAKACLRFFLDRSSLISSWSASQESALARTGSVK